MKDTEHDISVADNCKLSILIGAYVLVPCYNRRAHTEKGSSLSGIKEHFTPVVLSYSRGKRDQ